MSLDAESLRKILELESSKGYEDSAVIGGLDKFLRNWAGKAAESISSPKTLRRFNKLRLAEAGYSSLSREDRKVFIENDKVCIRMISFFNLCKEKSIDSLSQL